MLNKKVYSEPQYVMQRASEATTWPLRAVKISQLFPLDVGQYSATLAFNYINMTLWLCIYELVQYSYA